MSSSADRLHELTRAYSRYSRSAGGLAAVMGGVFCLVSYLAGALLPLSPALRVALIALPLLWLICKQVLATRYYQRFGKVEELSTPQERRTHLMLVGLTALVSGIVLTRFLLGDHPVPARAPWDPGSVGYLALVLVMPLLAWFWLRRPIDFVVGVFLLCQAALAAAGQAYPLWSSAVVFPLAALLMIATGIREHRKFLDIQTEIRALIQSRQASA